MGAAGIVGHCVDGQARRGNACKAWCGQVWQAWCGEVGNGGVMPGVAGYDPVARRVALG
jgi:hypothetical protein